MQLTVFNGSPRGKKGNTKTLMDKFLDGFRKIAGNDAEVHYLDNREKRKQAARIFANSEAVIVSFPLYSDSTPGLVKEFIESLAPFKGRKGNPGPPPSLSLHRYDPQGRRGRHTAEN
jgi:multimeric flavodoxin WrbA